MTSLGKGEVGAAGRVCSEVRHASVAPEGAHPAGLLIQWHKKGKRPIRPTLVAFDIGHDVSALIH